MSKQSVDLQTVACCPPLAVGLVDSERRGTWVWYRVRPETFRQLGALLELPATAEAAVVSKETR
ncbi:hypothetical protein ACTMS0_02005 [Micromonospora sp. H33]|uniref:hypothetical protein n=1 Tax=Micromonospora sp. H33 TaxID=3452215 RepID=UPI003F8CB495